MVPYISFLFVITSYGYAIDKMQRAPGHHKRRRSSTPTAKATRDATESSNKTEKSVQQKKKTEQTRKKRGQ